MEIGDKISFKKKYGIEIKGTIIKCSAKKYLTIEVCPQDLAKNNYTGIIIVPHNSKNISKL